MGWPLALVRQHICQESKAGGAVHHIDSKRSQAPLSPSRVPVSGINSHKAPRFKVSTTSQEHQAENQPLEPGAGKQCFNKRHLEMNTLIRKFETLDWIWRKLVSCQVLNSSPSLADKGRGGRVTALCLRPMRPCENRNGTFLCLY